MAQSNRVATRPLLSRTLISSAALGLSLACGPKVDVFSTSTGGASNSPGNGGSGAGGASAATPLVCPSTSGHVTQLPSGACNGTGSCTLVLDATCGPGVSAIPGTPPTYSCQCTSGNWSCTQTGGGFSLIPCGATDAGPNLNTGGASGMTDAGPNLATGGASNTTAVNVCDLSDSAAAALQMGQACAPDSCSPGGCFSSGSGPIGTGSIRMCVNSQVQFVTSTKLDQNSDGTYAGTNDGVSWADCESALANGRTGEACTGNAGECSLTTDDPCCIEAGLGCSNSAGTIIRYRFCAPGCTNVVPNNTLPTVTDCASVPPTTSLCRSSNPCQGNFVCNAGEGIATVPFTDSSVMGVEGILWCAGGNLVGGFAVGQGWAG